ncbi:hypothetical protein BV497_10690 [Fulvimonas soli]|nr:hypothetical protein BV497_10690 [Fulvimonas soli]
MTHAWYYGPALFVLGFALARAIYRRPYAPPAPPPDTSDEAIDAALRARRSVEAIRLYRLRTGCDLRTAKQAVQARAARLGPRP